MIHPRKAIDLEVIESEYQHDPTPSCERILLQTSKP